MAIDLPSPGRSRAVYVALVLLGLFAAMVAASTIGFIVHEYVTREELRNPPPVEQEHSALPWWLLNA